MIRFDDDGLEIKSSEPGLELSNMLAILKAVIPKEDFATAIVAALCAEIPKEFIQERKQDETVTQILKEMERRRASKNKGTANKHKG